eukprot:11569271-Ditylum_brightwellii.AAC.1
MTSNIVTIAGGQVIPLPPQAYIYVQGGTEVVGPSNEEDSIKQILHWVGLSDNTQKEETQGICPLGTGLCLSVQDFIHNWAQSDHFQCAMKDQADTKAKDSSPGPLDSENKWTDWEA